MLTDTEIQALQDELAKYKNVLGRIEADVALDIAAGRETSPQDVLDRITDHGLEQGYS